MVHMNSTPFHPSNMDNQQSMPLMQQSADDTSTDQDTLADLINQTAVNACLHNMNNESILCTTPSNKSPSAYIEIIVTLFLLIVGVSGNLLTILVMFTKYFKRMSLSVTLTALATSDLIFTLLFPFNKSFVREGLGVDIRSLSLAGCRTFFWLFRTSKMASSWFVVLVSIERFIATAFPIKVRKLSTKLSNTLCVTGVSVCLAVYNGVWTSYTDNIINGVCVPNTKPPGREKLAGNFLIIGLSIYALIPATILLICNPLTVRQLYIVKKRTRDLTVSQGTAVSYANRKTTSMLVGISVAFVVLVSPISLAHLLSFIWKQDIFESSQPGMAVFRDIAQVMEQLNYSINFLLYVLAGRKFRENVAKVILATCRKHNQVTPFSTSFSGQRNSQKQMDASPGPRQVLQATGRQQGTTSTGTQKGIPEKGTQLTSHC